MKAKRFERKYRISVQVRDYLLAYWRPHLAEAPFTNEDSSYPVLSQYYDSPRLVFYWQKLAGIGRRDKVRLRTYAHRFRKGGTCFLEIKRRINETISKYRVPMRDFASRHLDAQTWREFGDPNMHPFFALLESHRLRPSAQVLYMREAYECVEDQDLRVTFDSSLIGLHPGEVLTRDTLYDQSRAILPEREVILELKNRGPLPAWIRNGIQWADLQQESVPKYVLAVDALNLTKLHSAVLT